MLLRLFLFVVVFLHFAYSQDSDESVDTDPGKAESTSGFTADIVDFDFISKKENFDSTIETEKIIERSFFINNWKAVLNEGSRFPINKRFSYVRSVKVDKSKLDEKFKDFVGENVLGIRIMFPENKNSSFANVSQKFTVNPFFYKQRGKDSKRGFQENVGEIKKVSIVLKGKNYPVNIYLVFRDNNYNEMKIKMGNLNFSGWRVLEWKNQEYIQNPEDKISGKSYPLYPATMPYMMFEKIIFERPNNSRSEITTDFISYISKITLTYDKAIVLPEEDDIDDEETWGIYKHRINSARSGILDKFSQIEEIESLERKKMNISGAEEGGGSNNSPDTNSPSTTQPQGGGAEESSDDDDF